MSVLDIISAKGNKTKEFNNGDKIGYAFGDLGCGAFFMFVSSYLMLFYTDILGISATAVGTLFIVARVWDAINDPIMGVIVDKNKHTEHGKFKPYIVKYGIPMSLVGILAFTAIPGLPDNMKVPYAYVTYIAFGMLYTAVNIPYGSLASVMTSDPNERTALSTFRNIGSIVANLLVMLIVPKIVFTNGVVTAGGFLKCAIIFAIISSISYMITFRLTTERIVYKADTTKKVSVGNTIKILVKNRAFIGVTLASFTMLAAMFTGSSLNAYLYKEYFNNANLISLGGIATILPTFAVLPFVGMIVKRFGKKEATIGGSILAMLVYLVLFIMPITNPYVYIGLTMVAGLGTGLVNALIWALVADVIDYQEYLSGDRNEGIVYSSYSLCRKLSQAIAGGVGGFALGFLGYESGAATQVEAVGVGIKNIICGANFVGLAFTALILTFVYNLSKNKLSSVNEELNKKRMEACAE
ncbi:glycoside-pentoside-hexuronide (GPH):cation symporter [Clostridium baratii]|uniref:MFS transporter n=1 Tax=Clostridium baratii TaxID=1561 RepID=UPI0030CFCBF0